MTPAFRLLTLASLASVLVSAPLARATSVLPPTLDELVERSATIVRSHVSATRCEWRGEGEERRIVTVVSFTVDERVVGNGPASFDLEFLGGEVDGERMFVSGQTRFAVGQEDILFISRQTNAVSPLVRMMYGRFPVIRDNDNRGMVARANGSPLVRLDHIATPLGATHDADTLAQSEARDTYTPELFADAIRECARRQGRADVTEAHGGSAQ